MPGIMEMGVPKQKIEMSVKPSTSFYSNLTYFLQLRNATDATNYLFMLIFVSHLFIILNIIWGWDMKECLSWPIIKWLSDFSHSIPHKRNNLKIIFVLFLIFFSGFIILQNYKIKIKIRDTFWEATECAKKKKENKYNCCLLDYCGHCVIFENSEYID